MKFAFFPILLVCFALTAGCDVREDTENCDNTVLLRFSYTGDGETEIFNDSRLPSGELLNGKINRLDLYVFDENDQVLEGYAPYALSQEELASQSVRVKLPTNHEYHAVCIGNAYNSVTHNLREGSVYDTQLMHHISHPDSPTPDDLIDTYDHLYHGERQLALTRAGVVEDVVNINCSHIDMFVEVVAHESVFPQMSRAEGGQVLSIEHEGTPKWLDFSNTPSEETVSKHPNPVSIEDLTHYHEYQVKRNVEGSRIHIRDMEGNTVYTLDVTDFLENHSEIKDGLDLQEAILPIRIEFERVGDVKVTIPAWAIEKLNPEF